MQRSFASIVWSDLPLVNYAIYAVGIAHAEITNLPNQRLDLVPTAIFPMLVPWLIYGFRFQNASSRERLVGLIISLGAPLLIILNFMSNQRFVIDHDSLRNIYEYSAILNTVFLMIHARSQSRQWLKFFLGPCLIYGMILENGGIWLGYFSEMNYQYYLGPLPAPMATMSGWVTVFYIITWTVWEMKKLSSTVQESALAGAGVAVFAALAFDLQVDPLACEVGFWKWHPILDQGWLGVPLLNYAAWTAAVLPFSLLITTREKNAGLAVGEITGNSHIKWVFKRIPQTLIFAALLFLGFMVILEQSISGPTFQILAETFGL